jgi:catechol-2,3-dioxygenase
LATHIGSSGSLDMPNNLIQRAIQVLDPDGNEVEVFVDTEKPWRGDPSVFEKGLPRPLYL